MLTQPSPLAAQITTTSSTRSYFVEALKQWPGQTGFFIMVLYLIFCAAHSYVWLTILPSLQDLYSTRTVYGLIALSILWACYLVCHNFFGSYKRVSSNR